MAKLKDTQVDGNLIVDGDIQTAGKTYDKYDTLVTNGVTPICTNEDPNTTLEHEIVTQHVNCPTNEYWYIRTTSYLDKTTTGTRYQIAIPYGENITKAQHHRYFVNGAWSAWIVSLDNLNFRDYVAPVTGGFYANAEQHLLTGSNLNDCTNKNVMYRWDTSNNPTNAPATGCSMFFVQTGWGGTQFCFHYSENGTIWIRNLFISNWGSWRALV